MSSCDTCPTSGSCSPEKKEQCGFENNPFNHVKQIIGVMSGKGGVGKSTVSALLAYELIRNGYQVGLMDADITGPSIPRLVHLQNKRITSTSEQGMMPITAPGGLKVMSTNFLVDSEDSPVLWRGPMIGNLVKQFWTDVLWGDLDYLIIDMPPGTADVAITAMQSIPMNGLLMVTIPQDMVSMIVSKAIHMAEKMNVPILGIVENMSYLTCPHCHESIALFNYHENNFIDHQIPVLCKLPISLDLESFAEKGVTGIGHETLSAFRPVLDHVLSF